ncbi:growth hormone-regulated TBC protein 1 [Nilaparvata lugens]|uniref:growth hormone-regulated TBC protein 1 n=1 Tax=Nilaparvata lugens TaxID=108931 RepID=UPI00193E1CEC|nr:growth hormone-regulated TBC protein 1 [Nilaparvata lugens]
MANSRFSKVDEYGFERPSDFDYESYEDFMSQYLKVLAKRAKKWSTLMIDAGTFSKSRLAKRYIRKGIPSEHRGAVWLAVSGAEALKANFEPNLYDAMLEGPLDEKVDEIIRTDLPRTFPDNIYFNSTDNHQQQLYRVLAAYAYHNPTVGYCQGLNYVAGMLLLVTHSEDTSFWLLKVLVENKLPDYYSPTMDGVITDMEVLSELVKEKFPDIHSHLNSVGLPWTVITTKWFMCLFAEVLPTETALRVWDCLFYEGSKILFRVGLSLIGKHKQDILRCEDFASVVQLFKDMTQDSFALHCHEFMQNVFRIPGTLKRSHIERLRGRISEEHRKAKEAKATESKTPL